MQDFVYRNTQQPIYDMGLRKHLVDVFTNMSMGILLSGFVAAFVGLNPTLASFFLGGPQIWLFMLAPIGIVLWIGFRADTMTPQQIKVLFLVYCSAMGISLSTIFLIFKLGSIIQVFFISAATFGTMALYGYTTKKDLSEMGSFLIMGLIGIAIAGLVNIFLQSSVLQFMLSLLGLLIFIGLTAYDMQQIKEMYYANDGDDREKMGILGALTLYMDFINIFINMLNLIGEKD